MAKKQEELKGMPKKTDLEIQAQKVVEFYEAVKENKLKLSEEKDKLLPLMKASGRLALSLQDSEGNNLKIEIKENAEKINIKTDREEI
jgi:hypothetical protein